MANEIMTKKMPFLEQDGYVAGVIDSSIRKAHQAGKTDHRRPIAYSLCGVAASLLVILCIASIERKSMVEHQPVMANVKQMDSFDRFLNSLSKEETQMIQYYEIEEIYY